MLSAYQERLAEIAEHDPRYSYEAYEFVFDALEFTQKMLKRVPPDNEQNPGPEFHVSGVELLEGIRAMALQEYGRMARILFKLWGIQRTDDFGEIIFILVQNKLMSTTEQDRRDDFHEVYDFNEALVEEFHFELDEPEWMR
jgi:uncharacterized repeat protein (TIGR04138 family)